MGYVAIDTEAREVAAVTAFYGTRKGDYRKPQADVLGHFAEDDKWVPLKSVRNLETQIRSAGRKAIFHVYPGTKHWFFEKDRPGSYNPKAAQLAWKRTIAFFRKNLDW